MDDGNANIGLIPFSVPNIGLIPFFVPEQIESQLDGWLAKIDLEVN